MFKLPFHLKLKKTIIYTYVHKFWYDIYMIYIFICIIIEGKVERQLSWMNGGLFLFIPGRVSVQSRIESISQTCQFGTQTRTKTENQVEKKVLKNTIKVLHFFLIGRKKLLVVLICCIEQDNYCSKNQRNVIYDAFLKRIPKQLKRTWKRFPQLPVYSGIDR